MIRIYNNPPNRPSERDLKRLEGHIGFPIPIDYRDFLKSSNGGDVFPPEDDKEYNLFKAYDPFVEKFVECDELSKIYSVPPENSVFNEPYFSLIDMYKQTHDTQLLDLPKDVLIIGHTSNIRYVCMFLDGPKRGGMFHLIEDMPSELGARAIAKSFGEFERSVYQRLCSE